MDSISTSQVGVEDRISQSPDDVLVHILSFLPTVYSVRTMVLSKRWNNLWTSVPNLDFDQQDIRQGNFDSFATFVEGALLLHNSSSTIRKFRLHFLRNICLEDKRIARIRNWICTAMSSHEVGEVDISLVPYLGKNLELKLPQRLFLCKTLEVLRVESNCITYPSTKPGYFPSLKLADVRAEDGDHSSMGQIFCNCPVLEELHIYANMYQNDVEVHISAPELRTLRTSFFLHNYRMVRGISINAPKLENFVVYGSQLTKYIFKNAKSLVKANIDLQYFQTDVSGDCLHRATALLAGVSGVEYLCISGPNYVASSLPTFSNLKQLKLILLGSSYWEYVMELLKRSPKLEDLVLDIDVRSWYDEQYVQGYKPFTPPEIVPICVLSHLKTISITNITGHDDQLDVVKYLLKYGQVLKNVCMFTTGHLLFKTRHITEKKFQKKVWKYQKSSKTCEVEVKFENKGVGSWTCYDCGRSILYVDRG